MKYSRLDVVVRSRQMLELVMAAGTIMVAGAAQVVFDADAIFKATVTEPVGLLRPLQWEAVERIALTGGWEEPSSDETPTSAAAQLAARGARGKRIVSVRDLEETQVGLSRSEALAADIEGLGNRRQSASNAVVGLSNGIPMAVVASSFVKTPSIIEFRPVMNPASPALVNWLCGRQLEFAGIAAVPPREPTVPERLLPMSCRVRL